MLSAGTTVGMVAEGTAAAAAVAASIFTTETLKPKRLDRKIRIFSRTEPRKWQTLRPRLRRDLGDHVKSQMSMLTLTGNETTNSHEPDGFYAKLTLTAPGDPGAVSDYADYAGSLMPKPLTVSTPRWNRKCSSVVGVAGVTNTRRRSIRPGAENPAVLKR